MTEHEYNSHPGIRRSDLWVMRDSPEKYLYNLEHPKEPTPAMVYGQMMHKLLLEPATFGNEFIVAPEVDKRTREGRELWKEFCERNAGKTAVTSKEFQQAKAMAGAVLRHPIAKDLLHGKAEQPFFFTDGKTGLQCKCRADLVTEIDGKPVVVDYKTTSCAKTDTFGKSILVMGYHLQAFMYTEAVTLSMALNERPRFIFIAQEKDAPYSVNCIEAGEDIIDAGKREFRRLMDKVNDCMQTGYWYGYNGAFDELGYAELPAWAINEEEQ